MKKKKVEGGSLFVESVVEKIISQLKDISTLEERIEKTDAFIRSRITGWPYQCFDCKRWYSSIKMPDKCWWCNCGDEDDYHHSFHCGCDKFQGEKILVSEADEYEVFHCNLCFDEK